MRPSDRGTYVEGEFADMRTTHIGLRGAILAAVLLGCQAVSGCAGQPTERQRFNWAIQGQDEAIKGCPAQYRQTVASNGVVYVLGCWGTK
jgi:hypothetical protein